MCWLVTLCSHVISEKEEKKPLSNKKVTKVTKSNKNPHETVVLFYIIICMHLHLDANKDDK